MSTECNLKEADTVLTELTDLITMYFLVLVLVLTFASIFID